MKPVTALYILMTAIPLAVIVPATPAHADPIAITYSLTGTGTVVSATDTTLTLAAQAGGSVLAGNADLNAALNPVAYSDLSILDLTTSLLNGNFILSFANGDTLFGKVFEDDSVVDASLSQTGPFPQILTFTGGTGEFAGAVGSVSGLGFLGTTSFTVSGSGVVNAPAVPEPASAALLLVGLAMMIAGAGRYAATNAHNDQRKSTR